MRGAFLYPDRVSCFFYELGALCIFFYYYFFILFR